MKIKRWFLPIFLLVASVFLLVGCEASPGTPTESGQVWNLVIIGDSSLWELGEAFAAQIETDVGVEVNLEDFALPSLSAGEILEVLQTGMSANYRLLDLPDALQEADVVVMFVNPINSIDPERPLNLDGCFMGSCERCPVYLVRNLKVEPLFEKIPCYR